MTDAERAIELEGEVLLRVLLFREMATTRPSAHDPHATHLVRGALAVALRNSSLDGGHLAARRQRVHLPRVLLLVARRHHVARVQKGRPGISWKEARRGEAGAPQQEKATETKASESIEQLGFGVS